MNKLLLTFILLITTPFVINAQYSNYYKVDADVNINKKVDVSGEVNVNKTVKTIDYGALAQANAISERNRLNRMKFENEKAKEAVQAIIANPLAAFDYGQRGTIKIPTDVKRYGIKDGYNWGYKKFEWSFTVPHNYLFQVVQAQGLGFSFQNISENKIRTTFDLWGQFDVQGINSNKKKVRNYDQRADFYNEITSLLDPDKLRSNVLSEKNDAGKVIDGQYVHKVEVSRTSVCGCDGFRSTKVLEDEFEKLIVDRYRCSDGKRFFYAIAKYRANNDVSFEEIEGRRFYLITLIDKVVSTSDYGKTWE
tara:strand:+ start:71 stop:991 length:921 start_codon:yes stop_codon:yes gene_type:complete